MDCYERRQFDVLLATAAERLADRIATRFRDPATASVRLRADPQGEGIGLDEFVEDVFAEQSLDDVAGAAFVLQALHKRLVTTDETVSDVLGRLATSVFAELLAAKVVEVLAKKDRNR